VTLEVDLDDDGNTIIVKYNIGVKQGGDTLAPVLFLCYTGGTVPVQAQGAYKTFERKPYPECALSAPSKGPSCSEIEVATSIRDVESGLGPARGPGVFADDGAAAFAFGSRRDIERGARPGILYDHCVM
jgi:hypothetical protein